jgi:poly(ADP-ribose) glycohydrolase
MTQEEVLFSCCPECFPVMLFTEILEENEAVIIRGVKRFSDYTGYVSTFQWSGFYEPVEGCPIYTDVIVMDASMGAASQFTKPVIMRDLNKAYISFKAFAEGLEEKDRKVTTGHWGCGAFGGDKTLKFLQQLCAASVAGVSLDYSTFQDLAYCQGLQEIVALLKERQVPIATLARWMKEFPRNTTFRNFVTTSAKKIDIEGANETQ